MQFLSKNLFFLVRVFLGLFFIGSAITKLISIDSFEVFIYSLGVLNLNLSFLFARVVLVLEFFTGILLIGGLYLRTVIPATIGLLSLFTGFIIWLMLFASNRHCFCFGDLLEISNVISIIKNIVLIALLFVIRKSPDTVIRYRKIISLAALLISFSVTFIISPPDSFYFNRYSKSVTYNDVMLQNFLNVKPDFKKGKRVLTFYGTGCRFCKLAVQKISTIALKSGKAEMISCVFWGDNQSIIDFYNETNSIQFKYTILPPDVFLRITNGEMPLILLLEDGLLKGKFNYRSIDERQLIEFLTE